MKVRKQSPAGPRAAPGNHSWDRLDGATEGDRGSCRSTGLRLTSRSVTLRGESSRPIPCPRDRRPDPRLVPLPRTPGGFCPHLRVGLCPDRGSRPRPCPSQPSPAAPGPDPDPDPDPGPHPPALGPLRPRPGTARRPEGAGPARRRFLPALPPSLPARRALSAFPPAGVCPAEPPSPAPLPSAVFRTRAVRDAGHSSCWEPQHVQPR